MQSSSLKTIEHHHKDLAVDQLYGPLREALNVSSPKRKSFDATGQLSVTGQTFRNSTISNDFKNLSEL